MKANILKHFFYYLRLFLFKKNITGNLFMGLSRIRLSLIIIFIVLIELILFKIIHENIKIFIILISVKILLEIYALIITGKDDLDNFKKSLKEYKIRHAISGDINWICDKANIIYGQSTINYETKLKWFKRYPNGFWIITKGNKRIGSIEYFPIADNLKNQLENGMNENNIDVQHIENDISENTKYIYIENIMCLLDNNKPDHNALWPILKNNVIFNDLRRYKNIRYIANCVTNNSKILAKKHLGVKFGENNYFCITFDTLYNLHKLCKNKIKTQT